MLYSLQKASVWKRIAAWMLDAILVLVLATGLGLGLSAVLGYDSHYNQVEAGYGRYEAQYGVSFDISYEEYQALEEADRKNWDAAYDALRKDESVLYAYEMVLNLTLIITTAGILIAILLLEFVVPIFLGNGQTVGKKVFGLCLIRNDGVIVNKLQLLTRALLGKATVETLIPVYVLLMLFWGTTGIMGIGLLLLLLIAQVLCVGITKTNSAIHDLMGGTVVVDAASQMIFKSTDELVAYQKKVAAERAARQSY